MHKFSSELLLLARVYCCMHGSILELELLDSQIKHSRLLQILQVVFGFGPFQYTPHLRSFITCIERYNMAALTIMKYGSVSYGPRSRRSRA